MLESNGVREHFCSVCDPGLPDKLGDSYEVIYLWDEATSPYSLYSPCFSAMQLVFAGLSSILELCLLANTFFFWGIRGGKKHHAYSDIIDFSQHHLPRSDIQNFSIFPSSSGMRYTQAGLHSTGWQPGAVPLIWSHVILQLLSFHISEMGHILVKAKSFFFFFFVFRNSDSDGVGGRLHQSADYGTTGELRLMYSCCYLTWG